jgi:hypothetical protein
MKKSTIRFYRVISTTDPTIVPYALCPDHASLRDEWDFDTELEAKVAQVSWHLR